MQVLKQHMLPSELHLSHKRPCLFQQVDAYRKTMAFLHINVVTRLVLLQYRRVSHSKCVGHYEVQYMTAEQLLYIQKSSKASTMLPSVPKCILNVV